MVSNAKKTMTPEEFVSYVNTEMTDMNPAGIIYDYALELHKNGKIDNAIYMYNAAIKVDNKNPEIYVNLALAQAQAKNYDGALNTLNSAQTKFPKNTTIADTSKNISAMKTDETLNKAADAYNNKDYQTAINNYLAISPATTDSMRGVASAYYEMGNLDKAIEYYQKH